tara:strand:- start:6631 stop:7473 length:843 start_codon:yes stop_codon:yes gene_type:complete
MVKKGFKLKDFKFFTDKNSQISVYLVLGVVLIVVVILFSYFDSSNQVEKDSIKSFDLQKKVQSIKLFTESCIKKTAKEGIELVGLQGGYYNNLQLSVPYSYLNIPYYNYLGEISYPNIEIVELEISQYIEDNLLFCLDEFDEFSFDYSAAIPKVNTKFINNGVDIDVNLPLIIKNQGEESTLITFKSFVDFNFNFVYDIIQQIITEEGKNPNFMPIGFLMDLSHNNNFTFEIIPFEDNTLIYVFIFNDVGEEPYLFSYTSKYSWKQTSQEIKEESELVIG